MILDASDLVLNTADMMPASLYEVFGGALYMRFPQTATPAWGQFPPILFVLDVVFELVDVLLLDMGPVGRQAVPA